MRTRKLLAKTLDMLGLESRAELEHLVDCHECDLFYDGQWYCDEFMARFRPHWSSSGGKTLVPISPLFSKLILAALQKNIVFGSQDVDPAADSGADESLAAQDSDSSFD